MGQAFLHGNGGSNPMNFEVVASATTPSNPKENTLWVQTSDEAKNWYFCTEEPDVFEAKLLNGSNERWIIAPHKLKAGDILNFIIPATVSSDFYDININDPITGKSYAVRQYGGTAGGAWHAGTTLGLKISDDLNPIGSHCYDGTAYVSSWGYYYHEEGTVWIPTGANSDAQFNALKKNALNVYPTAAKQYVGGAWANKAARIYKSSGWVQFSSLFSATINVTCPSGSTLTCTDGTTTLTATTTTGSYAFTVPNTGTWTVKAVSGSNTASKSVSITTDGQSASVTLSYTTYYYNKGDQCTSVTGGWSAGTASSGYTAGSPTIGSDSITCVSSGAYVVTSAATVNKVDLSNISKLTIVSPSGSSADNGYYGYFYVSTSRDAVAAAAASVMIPKGGSTVTLDVSGLSGSYYLMLRMLAGANGSDQVDMSVCYGV